MQLQKDIVPRQDYSGVRKRGQRKRFCSTLNLCRFLKEAQHEQSCRDDDDDRSRTELSQQVVSHGKTRSDGHHAARQETIRKCDRSLVRRRPVVAGIIINAPARSAPRKRRPTRTDRLNTRRKYSFSLSSFTPVAAANSGENRPKINSSLNRKRKKCFENPPESATRVLVVESAREVFRGGRVTSCPDEASD